MRLLPVIERELRAESRHAFTYFLRLCGATFPIGVLAIASLGENSGSGKDVFWIFHAILFFLIWISAPLATFDALSREKREGTLGLLFLTPLRPTDIVLAKAFVQTIRLFGLVSATLPVMCVPLLMGGVGWRDAAFSLLINASSVFGAVAAGLIASAFSKRMAQALGCAFLVSIIYLLLFNLMLPAIVLSAANNGSPFAGNTFLLDLDLGRRLTLGAFPFWNDFLLMYGPGMQPRLSIGFGILAIVSACWFLVNVYWAGERIRKTWQGEPPSPRQMWWQKKFCTPTVGEAFYKRWLRRKLEGNPVGWLEERSWSSRAMRLGWPGLIIIFYCLALFSDDLYHEIGPLQGWALVFLFGSLGVSTALSFRRERETGLLELMLVSPLKAETIVSGRVRGLRNQFIAAMVLIAVFWWYLRTSLYSWHRDDINVLISVSLCVGTFLALPGTGLYFSLRLKHLLAGLAATFLTVCVIPVMLIGLLTFLLFDSDQGFIFAIALLGAQIWIGRFFVGLLIRDLRTRRFALEKTGVG